MATFLRKGGGYRKLKVYKLSEAIFDLTEYFAQTYIERGSRTKDQMIQSARSGKQNIAEGSEASTTYKGTEIQLTNVAKASLEELLLDYEDYLRQHNLEIWSKDHPRVLKLRTYLQTDRFLANPMEFSKKMAPLEYCNLCLTLINQATYMLSRLLDKQQEQFLKEGGIREQMYKARQEYRKNHPQDPAQSDKSDKSDLSDQSDKSD